MVFIIGLTVWGVNPLTAIEAATFKKDFFVEEIVVSSENDLSAVGGEGTFQMIAPVKSSYHDIKLNLFKGKK